MARKNRKDSRPAHVKASMKAQAGIRRAEHFASGGTVDGWLGTHIVCTDRRKDASKKACRGRVW